jgi:hypothetical protein
MDRLVQEGLYKLLDETPSTETSGYVVADAKTDLDRARLMVQAATSLSLWTPCPGCDRRQSKDDGGCMHLRCGCGVHYCFACGRRMRMGVVKGVQRYTCLAQCDSVTPYLHNVYDVGDHAAASALLTFHTRLASFYVAVVRELVGETVWEALMLRDPDLLRDVVGGRAISDGLLSQASTALPLLGNLARHRAKETKRRRAMLMLELDRLGLWRGRIDCWYDILRETEDPLSSPAEDSRERTLRRRRQRARRRDGRASPVRSVGR